MSDISTFLFARPSLLEGAGRILDFGNTLFEYNVSETPDLADARAIYADWLAVGMDMTNAVTKASDVQKLKAP